MKIFVLCKMLYVWAPSPPTHARTQTCAPVGCWWHCFCNNCRHGWICQSCSSTPLYFKKWYTAMFSKLDEFIDGIDAYITDECRICLCSWPWRQSSNNGCTSQRRRSPVPINWFVQIHDSFNQRESVNNEATVKWYNKVRLERGVRPTFYIRAQFMIWCASVFLTPRITDESRTLR